MTESAAQQIQAQLVRRGTRVGLRIGAKKVSCSGFAYTFDYADEVRTGEKWFESYNATVDGKE